MKKIVLWVMAIVLCVSLYSCGGETKQAGAKLGDMVDTDVLEFTLDRAQLALALNNTFSTTNANEYGTPKEYNPEEDASNPNVSSVGHSFVFVSFTCRSLDRNTLDFAGSFNPQFTSVEYNGEQYNNDLEFTAKHTAEKVNWSTYSSTNVLLSPGETVSMRGYIDIPVEAALTDSFDITFYLPTSSGETQSFVYTVTEADLDVAVAKEEEKMNATKQAAADAIAARKTEADKETVFAVKQKLQGEWEYTDGSVKHILRINGDDITVTSSSVIGDIVKKGKYTVVKKDIFIDFESEDFIDCFMPYTFENGELEISPLENIEQ